MAENDAPKVDWNRDYCTTRFYEGDNRKALKVGDILKVVEVTPDVLDMHYGKCESYRLIPVADLAAPDTRKAAEEIQNWNEYGESKGSHDADVAHIESIILNHFGPDAIRQARRETWTQDVPRLSGWYWHWDGDADSAPLPTSVMWSGFNQKCFVSTGQLGLTHAIDCDEYGGWWMPLENPKLP